MVEVRDTRFDPRMPWLAGRFDGPPVTAGWMRFTDGREPDGLSMPFFADGLPPVTFATGRFGYTTDTVQRIIGQPPTPFERFARENAGAFA